MLLLLVVAPAAEAHSFGRSYILPVPLWMYLYGAAAALALSFVVSALLLKQVPGTTPVIRPVVSAARWQRWLQGRLVRVLQALLAGLFVLAICTGFWGSRDPYINLNMTLFWVVFLLGYAYLAVLIGDSYTVLSPWWLLDRLLQRWRQRVCREYPAAWNYWPAFFQYGVLISIELFTHTTPKLLSQCLLAYALITTVGIWRYGAASWLRYADAFSVMFQLMARLSPLQVTRQGLNWQGLAGGLLDTPPRHLALLLLLLFLLSSTAFDGLHETRWWFGWFWGDRTGWLTAWLGSSPIYHFVWLRPYYLVYEMVWLWLSPLLYLSVFALFMWLAKCLTGSSLSVMALCLRFAYSLLPIALVYNITHYYTLIFTQGVKIVSLVSDPFGWGWNLFGTAGLWRAPILPDVALIWHVQVLLIVLGHVLSVYIAHKEALRTFATPRAAMLSQLPLLVLMMLFTASGLWILAQPIGAQSPY